ncbi:MAG: glycosyltransferase family 2 protein [Candidatus Schekmanbacteria bacterium]|nr:glycosyltransferase family 2 protein [Candidatus Schekmanbacteria bacterium]
MAFPELSIVFPFYNEEKNIPHVVPKIIGKFEETGLNYELVLVDNGSWDQTANLLEQLSQKNPRLKIVTVKVNQGYGWGIICGLQEAAGQHVGYMCSDGQITPDDVCRVYRLIQEGKCDLAKVNRVSRHDGRFRKIQSVVYNYIFSNIFKIKSLDINGTPKIFAQKYLPDFALISQDWFLDAELMIKAQFMGLKVGEVDVDFLPRAVGKSNVKWTTVWEFLKNMYCYLWGGELKQWKKSRS